MVTHAKLNTILCSTFVAASSIGCSRDKPFVFDATPKTWLGERYRLTVENTEQCKALEDPKKGNVTLGVELTFEATTSERMWVPGEEQKLIDSKGTTYDPRTSAGCLTAGKLHLISFELRPVLYLGNEVDKSRPARGWLTFEVPEDARSFTLSVRPVRAKDRVSEDGFWLVRQPDREARFNLVRR
jgi:hypothetical protein